MPGKAVKLYMNEDDLALWEYGIALLGRDRVRREILKFIRGPFQEILKEESQSPRRKEDARQVAKELMARREAQREKAKQRRKVPNHVA